MGFHTFSAQSTRRSRVSFGQYQVEQEAWRANEFLGMGLFFVIGEVARREATEGTLWKYVPPRFPVCREQLFTPRGQPTQLLKDGLEVAARRGYLRHVFGVTGTQEWYLSVFLQFGFTGRAIAQIPHWLCGHPKTESVSILLGEHDRYSEAACSSFTEFWHALLQLRHRNQTADQVRRAVTGSPFVLAEWIDLIIQEASRPVEHHPDFGGGTPGSRELDIFENPYLRWPTQGEPRLYTNCKNLALVDLAGVGHKVKVDGVDSGYLSYDPDNGHFLQEDLPLPNRLGSCVVELECEGKSVHQQELPLWNIDEEVSVFRARDGRAIDPHREPMKATDSYYVAVAPDLILSPETASYHRQVGSPVHIYRLDRGWPVALRAYLGGFEIWKPPLAPLVATEPPWARGIVAKRGFPTVIAAVIGPARRREVLRRGPGERSSLANREGRCRTS